MQTRFSFGGDEHIFAEVDDSMSLEAFFKSLFITNAVRDAKIKGVTEICPANASYQVKFDPDLIKPDDMLAELKRLDSAAEKSEPVIATRIIEIPVLYNDPWTHETLMRFRERHQDPNGTDLEYAARINNHDWYRRVHQGAFQAPWFVSMVGFVAGLPFLYQMVERQRQIRRRNICARARTRPSSRSGIGGCFSCIYSVRGAGGYQMFGITPMPIYDPNQKISYLRDFMCLFKPGDIVKWKPIDRPAYDAAVADVDAGRFAPIIRNVSFSSHRVQPRHRWLQSQARGGPPWPLRSQALVLRPPSRTSAVPATITSASRSRAAWTGLRLRPPTCSWATRKEPPFSRPSSWDPSSSLSMTRRLRSRARSCRPSSMASLARPGPPSR